MSRTFVIGECASAHDGDLQKALRLIDAASDAGCDAAKFQLWSNAARLADRRLAWEYYEAYRRYTLPDAWLPRLRARAESRGLELMVTTFLPEDIAIVAPFVDRFKVSSFEAKDDAFVRAHSRWPLKQLIVSVGMMEAADVQHLTDVLYDNGYSDKFLGFDNDRAVLMHCVSAYPAPAEDLNLAALRWCYLGFKNTHCGLGVRGYSDHSGLIETGALAVAAGAKILEVHLKLPTTDPENPDAGEFALLPDALGDYVSFMRQAEQMLGTGVKQVMPSEAAMQRYQVRV